MGKWLSAILLGALVLTGGMRLREALINNLGALEAVAQLAPTTSCAADEVRWQWVGPQGTFRTSPHIQAAVAAAAGTEVLPPALEEWTRDVRLYHWFRGQTAVKNKQFRESLLSLQLAGAGPMLDVAGRTAVQVGHPECLVINWAIAEEIGHSMPLDGYVQGMLNNQQWQPVLDAAHRLQRYDEQRATWQLWLAKAYLGMGVRVSATEALTHVLANGNEEEVQAAKKLLQNMP